jgi:hypothetical protein
MKGSLCRFSGYVRNGKRYYFREEKVEDAASCNLAACEEGKGSYPINTPKKPVCTQKK